MISYKSACSNCSGSTEASAFWRGVGMVSGLAQLMGQEPGGHDLGYPLLLRSRLG